MNLSLRKMIREIKMSGCFIINNIENIINFLNIYIYIYI